MQFGAGLGASTASLLAVARAVTKSDISLAALAQVLSCLPLLLALLASCRAHMRFRMFLGLEGIRIEENKNRPKNINKYLFIESDLNLQKYNLKNLLFSSFQYFDAGPHLYFQSLSLLLSDLRPIAPQLQMYYRYFKIK